MKKKKSKKSLAQTFKELRAITGGHWDNVICVCRELMKDNPCDVNCKEFHDEILSNRYQSSNK